jgi:hypothetical protein
MTVKNTTAPLYLLTIALMLATALPVQSDDQQPAKETIPGGYRITSDDGVIRFPFDVYRGDIRFQCKVNGHDVHMLLDDGFMWDQLAFWGSPRVDSLDMQYDGDISIGNKGGDADRIEAKTASGITLSFPGVDFTDQAAIITPYDSGTSTMWSGSVGQVSATLFKHFVVDINFDDMMITLIEPDRFEYGGDGVEIPWLPMGFGPWKIPATLGLADGRAVSLDLMMDLGYNDQLQIATGGEHSIAAPDGAAPASLGMNIQRVETRGHVGNLKHVSIGGYRLNGVPAGFVLEEHADHTYHEAMIGLGLLSRFNLVFDFTRQRLIIEPNDTFADPFA